MREGEERRKKKGAFFLLFGFIFVAAVAANYVTISRMSVSEYVDFVDEAMKHRGFYMALEVREDFERLAKSLIAKRTTRGENNVDVKKAEGEGDKISNAVEEKLSRILKALLNGIKRMLHLGSNQKKGYVVEEERLSPVAAITAALCFTIFDFTTFLVCFFLAATLGLLVGLGEGIYRRTVGKLKLLLDGEVIPEVPSAFEYFLLLRATLRIIPFCAGFHLWAMPFAFARWNGTGAAVVFAADAALAILAVSAFVKRFIGEMPKG